MNKKMRKKPTIFVPFFKTFNGKKYQPMGIYPNKEEMLYDLKRCLGKHNILLEVEKCDIDNSVMLWSRKK